MILINIISNYYYLLQATVESQLRNAVQTQLDGVQNGLDLLKEFVNNH